MPLRPADLDRHLAGTLAPAYLISGDETLLLEESCDAVLTAARSQGFDEREVLHADGGFRWGELIDASASMSLFASRRVLDLRLPTNKVDREASDILREYLASAPEDVLLLVRMPKLDGRQKNSAWFKAFDQTGIVLQVWPLGRAELPRWLRQRARRLGIDLASDALGHLADVTEGNLLAARQELDKLVLLDLPQPVELDALLAATADSASYGAFDLIDTALLGDGARVRRMLQALIAEGTTLFALQGALRSQFGRLIGGGATYGPREKQQAVAAFRKRLDREPRLLDELRSDMALIDAQAKGAFPGDAWVSFERLLLRLAGYDFPSLEVEAAWLRG
ncbi:MAG: DNA polymerase III subunit delta [Pseudomonadota bacterium]